MITGPTPCSHILAGALGRCEDEEALRQERGQLLSIFDSIDEPIYVADPDSFELLFVNRALQATIGKDPTGGLCYRELQGFGAPCSFCTNDVLRSRPHRTHRWEYSNPLLKKTYSLHDRLIRWPDGRDVRLEVALDITQMRQLEEHLQAAQRMEAIGRLAGGVAHDFNNLLSVILSCSAFALEGLREEDPLREDILEIRRAGDRAAELTRQLLAFSRKQVLVPQVLDLNEVVLGLEKMLRRLIGEHIVFEQVLAPDLRLVKADPAQLEQVIMNLVVNARDAMPKGGLLIIETTNVVLDEDYAAGHAEVSPGPHVRLAVSDTGSGMDAATRQRVFEPFFTTKKTGEGTGLGLPTAYGVIKQSGGHIWVYSEPGQGTTFKVYLPIPKEPVERSPVPQGRRDPGGGTETILVVEDEDAVRRIACRMLGRMGYQVLSAASGGEALLLCEQHPGEIHLLLTDVVMPQMSGRQLAERLQRLRPGLRMLYMSGYTENAIVHHGVLDAGTEFIGKPFTEAALKRRVREALNAPGSAP